MKVKDVLSAYLRWAVAQARYAPKSLKNVERIYRLFAEAHGDDDTTGLPPHLLEDWVLSRQEWKTGSTRRVVAALIKAAFNWAASPKQQRIPANPFKGTSFPESDPRGEVPDDVLERAYREASKPLEIALRFLRLTGVREGELCSADWPDMDLDEGLWRIQKHKGRWATRKPKPCYMTAEAVELLRGLRAERLAAAVPVTGTAAARTGPVLADLTQPGKLAGPVFLNSRGRRWTERSLRKGWEKLRDRLGIDAPGLHGIRHRMITAGAENGASVLMLQKIAGHAHPETTMRYIHLDDKADAIRAAAEKAAPRQKPRGAIGA